MTARPDGTPLSGEDRDLLLSRALDGDLSPEEERELAALLAADPTAARRREELAELVSRLNALPAPAPPLGMAARVNAHTADHAKGIGAIWHRLGLFPPPAMVRGIAALFVIVVIGMNVLKSQSARQKPAEEAATPAPADGRVTIFFDEKRPAAPAAPAPAAKARSRAANETAEADDKKLAASKENASARVGSVAEPQAGAPAVGGKGQAAGMAMEADASRRDAPAAPAVADALESRPEAAGTAGGVRSEAPLQKKAKAEAAPAAPAPEPSSAAAPVSWDVAVVGPAARQWALRRFAAPPPARAGIAASYRLTLDAAGQVVELKALEGATPETDALARSLVFTPLGADAPARIEVNVRTR